MKQKLTVFELIFLPLALACLIGCGIYFKSGWLVTLCTVLGMTGSVLNGSGRKYCYFFLLASSLMYVYICYSNQFYGEAILHLCYVSPMFLYSAIRWFFPRKEKKTASVFRLSVGKALLLLGVISVLAAGYGYVLSRIGTKLPYLNAVSTAAAVAANYLSARRMKEQWVTQLFSNAALIALWLISSSEQQGNLPLMVQNVLFVISNLRGAIVWNREYKASAPKTETE